MIYPINKSLQKALKSAEYFKVDGIKKFRVILDEQLCLSLLGVGDMLEIFQSKAGNIDIKLDNGKKKKLERRVRGDCGEREESPVWADRDRKEQDESSDTVQIFTYTSQPLKQGGHESCGKGTDIDTDGVKLHSRGGELPSSDIQEKSVGAEISQSGYLVS